MKKAIIKYAKKHKESVNEMFLMESSNFEIQLIYMFIHSIIVESILPKNNAICVEKGVIIKVAKPVNKIIVVSGITTILATKNNTGN